MPHEEEPWKYPPSKPHHQGMLRVSEDPPHSLYWEEHGNPIGTPVMVLHGGPGYGCGENLPRIFDPAHYRIILFDQRGAKRSTPFASLEANTTPHLVADINRLREHLRIERPMHLFGGSWGSTLALAYAIDHAANVKSMILRGVFLCRKADIDFFYQGNAAEPNQPHLMGAGRYFPEDWKYFVELAPKAKRHDMIAAYHEMLHSTDKIRVDGRDIELGMEAAKRWCQWESATLHLIRQEKDIKAYAENPQTAVAPARIENHYFMNGAFLGGTSRDQNHIIEHIDNLKDIPTQIVHGRYDMVCPRDQADDLMTAWRAATADQTKWPLLHIADNAGHGLTEPAIIAKLTEVMESLRIAR